MKTFYRTIFIILAILNVILMLASPIFAVVAVACVIGAIKAEKVAEFAEKNRELVAAQKIKKVTEKTEGDLIIERYQVAGTYYCESNIKKLACSNPDWKLNAKQIISAGKESQRIYRYKFINKPVKLIPEPKNEHDKNAIVVMIAGEKVGYISRDENIHVNKVLKRKKIKFISSFIGGGEYKVILPDAKIDRNEDSISITIKIGYNK